MACVNLCPVPRRGRACLLDRGTGVVEDTRGGADVHIEGDAVVRVAWDMRDTSVASSFQVNKAVVQNTCPRLCQVHLPLPPGSRHPTAR